MAEHGITFRVHAVQRMFERGISEVEVRQVLETGEVIEDYPDEAPYPARLILGFCDGRSLHVVAAGSRRRRDGYHYGVPARPRSMGQDVPP